MCSVQGPFPSSPLFLCLSKCTTEHAATSLCQPPPQAQKLSTKYQGLMDRFWLCCSPASGFLAKCSPNHASDGILFPRTGTKRSRNLCTPGCFAEVSRTERAGQEPAPSLSPSFSSPFSLIFGFVNYFGI